MKDNFNELFRKVMYYIYNAPREIQFSIEQRRFISEIFGKIKEEMEYKKMTRKITARRNESDVMKKEYSGILQEYPLCEICQEKDAECLLVMIHSNNCVVCACLECVINYNTQYFNLSNREVEKMLEVLLK